MTLALLYDFFRAATGLCLLLAGMGFLLEPARQKSFLALGAFYVSAGLAFLFSWFSTFHMLPAALDLGLLLLITFTLGLSVLDFIVYLFGGEARQGSRRRLVFLGLLWSLLLWVLPLLDLVLSFESTIRSIEDQQALTPFRAVAYFAVYLWPFAMLLVAIRIAHYKLADLPKDSSSLKLLIRNLALAAAILVVIGLGLLWQARGIYQAGHIALQLCLLVWSVGIRARPDLFVELREDIAVEHKRRVAIDTDESGAIGRRLDKLLRQPGFLSDSGLKLTDLAKLSSIPAYRLSAYFNTHCGLTFSEWLNQARIAEACRLLREKPSMTILEIAFEVGYASKGTFNSQFLRQQNLTPSAYRTVHKKVGVSIS